VDFSQPLQSATVTEARNACVTVSDNALFQRLCKLFKEFSFSCISATDAMLLGGSEVEDKIVVEEPPGDPRAFVAHFELARFRLRMRVAKRVCVEFVARGRMWNITFSTCHGDASSGIYRAWKITLRLGEHSAPTWIDAQLVIITSNSSGRNISISFQTEEERMLGHEKLEGICIVLGQSATGTDPEDVFASHFDEFGVSKARLEARLAKKAPPPSAPTRARAAPAAPAPARSRPRAYAAPDPDPGRPVPVPARARSRAPATAPDPVSVPASALFFFFFFLGSAFILRYIANYCLGLLLWGRQGTN